MNQLSISLVLALLLANSCVFCRADPIQLHPENPHWFQWRGRTVALITSAEHYGAVLNLDFDMHRYLETMARDGMNYTRIFAGSYVEPQGAFGIQHNTLAPAAGRFLAPWARAENVSDHDERRFDLEQFSPEYLARLKEFLAAADRHGIVVELTFFSSTYGDQQWARHPLNPHNNLQQLPISDWKKINTSENGKAVMAVQERLVRWLVRELNGFDNLFFEIQNEPWADNHTMGDFINPYLVDHHRWPNAVQVTAADSIAWQRKIARAIVDEEQKLPKQHLIAQNVANFRLALTDSDLVPEAKIINFHYAYPEAVSWNRGLERLIGYDESGFCGREDTTYRRQAWNFVMSGGGLFNSLDYSFCVGKEDGTQLANQAPGGGSPTLRQQLSVLSQFLHSFQLERLHPDCHSVQRSAGVVARTLSSPGHSYAIYLEGRGPVSLVIRLPANQWTAEWISTSTGEVIKRESVAAVDQDTTFVSPEFTGDIAVRILRK